MKNSLFLLITLILFLCTGCPDQDDKPDSVITIKNNSIKDVLYDIRFRIPSDTILSINSVFPTQENISINLVKANSERSDQDSFIKILEENPNKVLMLYLFSRETIEQVPWEQVVDDYLILRRYDLTLQDLQDLNWTIEYP